MTTSFKAFMTRGSNMTRETLMVLKRFMMMALGALGTLGMGALFVGTASAASAEIPAPKALAGVAACIVANTPPAMGGGQSGGPPSAGPDILTDNPPVPVAMLFMPRDCMGGDIDLAMRIEQAGSRFMALSPESDDYADDLAELRAEFSGPVMDAVFEEVLAERAARKASFAYETAQTAFLSVEMDEGNPVGVRQKYLALAATEDDGDAEANDISYSGLLNTIEYERDDRGQVTGIITFGTNSPTSVASTSKIHIVDGTTKISTVIDMWKDPAVMELEDAEAALRLVAAGDLVLASSEVQFLQDVVRFRTDEIAKLDALITDIEQVEGNNVDTAAEYQTAKVALESQLSTLTSAISNQARKKSAVRNALIDPGQHLDQLVALAQSDYDDAVERGLTGGALMSFTEKRDKALAAQAAYDRAAGDSDNPAGELLTALIAQDDTGQALLTAVSDTYGKTVENKTAIDGLAGDDGLVAANTAHLVDHEERITTNRTDIDTNRTDIDTNRTDIDTNRTDIDTNKAGIATNRTDIDTNRTGIATNKAEIVRVEERVDSNWDAIGANQMDIATNRSNINGLRKGLDVATAGVAAAMALAALPDVEGARSFGVGLGTFDGKTAVAVGFSYGTERFTFKVGAATASGETGGSAGIGWAF